MLAHDLLLAHPSICSELESQSLQMDMLKRQPINKLRYTTAVDTLAPLFDMAFFQDTVVETLQNATLGKVQCCNISVYIAVNVMHGWEVTTAPRAAEGEGWPVCCFRTTTRYCSCYCMLLTQIMYARFG